MIDWRSMIQNKKDELLVAIKRAYINACVFEDSNDVHYVNLWYQGTVFYCIRDYDVYLYEEGLAYCFYSVRQFDCTKTPLFNYQDYMTEGEYCNFQEWCGNMGYLQEWPQVKIWSKEIYDRIGAKHRQSMIEQFDPEATFQDNLKHTYTGRLHLYHERRYGQGPTKFPVEPKTAPEFALRYYLDYFDRIHDPHDRQGNRQPECPFGGKVDNQFMHAKVPRTYLVYMLEIMNNFDEQVSPQFCEEVYFALSRHNCWNKPTRTKILLEGCTYKELATILQCDYMEQEYLARRSSTKLIPYNDEDHIIFEESLGPLGIQAVEQPSLDYYGWFPL